MLYSHNDPLCGNKNEHLQSHTRQRNPIKFFTYIKFKNSQKHSVLLGVKIVVGYLGGRIGTGSMRRLLGDWSCLFLIGMLNIQMCSVATSELYTFVHFSVAY